MSIYTVFDNQCKHYEPKIILLLCTMQGRREMFFEVGAPLLKHSRGVRSTPEARGVRGHAPPENFEKMML